MAIIMSEVDTETLVQETLKRLNEQQEINTINSTALSMLGVAVEVELANRMIQRYNVVQYPEMF